MSGPPRDPAASSDQLSQRKRELVEKLLRKQAAEAGRNPILRRTDAASAPLSYSQEQLWVLHRMNPLGTAYNVTFALTFKRGVDELLLRGALAELVRRHQILRTVFEPRGDQTVQVVGPESVVTFDAADLPQLSDSERAAELRRLGLTELQRAFDLERGPVGRAVLVRSCEAPAVLFLSFHHIAVDEWSTAILVEELQAIYAALASGVPSPLPELPIQYADYAAWQRHSVRGASFDGQRAYWKQQLAGLPTVRLPIAKERPADPGSTSARDSILLPESLTSGLNELSRRHGVTLFTTLLAGYSALLARYSGQEDIVLGSPVANRQHAETERIIGFFMNMVVLRTATPFRESFRELLRRTHGVVAGAVANQDLPFEEVVSALAPRRRLGENPLFQLTFDLRRDGAPSEVEVTAVVDDADSARFDLEVHAVDHGDAISLNAAYSTDLFDQQGISRLLRHFQTLLESIVADDERPIGLLPILNDAERQALGCTHRVDHAEPCETFVAAFERHVSASATAPAVVSGHDELTYESLDARASGLARWLAARGAARGSIVAVCLDRGPDFVTAVLGVMKAGAAYVPIDPDYPRDRIAFMLHDARASLVLTHERLRELVEPDPADAEPGVAPVEIVCLDRDLARFAGPESVEIHAPDPDDLAYVITRPDRRAGRRACWCRTAAWPTSSVRRRRCSASARASGCCSSPARASTRRCSISPWPWVRARRSSSRTWRGPAAGAARPDRPPAPRARDAADDHAVGADADAGGRPAGAAHDQRGRRGVPGPARRPLGPRQTILQSLRPHGGDDLDDRGRMLRRVGGADDRARDSWRRRLHRGREPADRAAPGFPASS